MMLGVRAEGGAELLNSLNLIGGHVSEPEGLLEAAAEMARIEVENRIGPPVRASRPEDAVLAERIQKIANLLMQDINNPRLLRSSDEEGQETGSEAR